MSEPCTHREALDRVTDLFEKWATEENLHRTSGEYGLAEGLNIAITDLRGAVHGAPKCPICGSTKLGGTSSCDCEAHREIPTPWPFAPGDVVHDSGPDGDDAAWLEAAPDGTLVNDGDGWDFVRDSGAWWHTDSWHMTSERLAERGPLTVVSVEAAR